METMMPTEQGHGTETWVSRPFGLRFARPPRGRIDLDLDQVRYDEERQVAVALDGPDWVPLADHSLSVTLQTSGDGPREDEIYDKSFR
jgi:putative ATP-grasp target RiPP